MKRLTLLEANTTLFIDRNSVDRNKFYGEFNFGFRFTVRIFEIVLKKFKAAFQAKKLRSYSLKFIGLV